MCGLVSFIGKPKNNVKFRSLVTSIFNNTEIRGKHASGFAAACDKKSYIVHSKLPIKSSLFTKHDRFYNSFWNRDPSMFLGHCRFATSGNPSVNKNNHPFSTQDKSIWLVHNGTASSMKTKELESFCETDCDSEYIIRAVELYGMNEGLEMLCNSLSQFACILLDKNNKKLHFVRNSGRPLFFADVSKLFHSILLVSTKEIFYKSFNTLGLNLEDVKLYEVKINTHYTFDLNFNLTSEKIKVKSYFNDKVKMSRYKKNKNLIKNLYSYDSDLIYATN